MSHAFGFTKIMTWSANWMAPLNSPAAALAGKFFSLLWTFQMQA